MIGWICVSTIAQYFKAFEKCIPWIALILLGYIGGKMLYDGIKNKDSCEDKPAAGKASIFGGAILIFIGLEIFITSWF